MDQAIINKLKKVKIILSVIVTRGIEKTEIKVNQQIVYDEKYYFYLLMGIVLIFVVELLRRLFLRDIV
jgi:hypothetical protein